MMKEETKTNYINLENYNACPIKMWTKDVPVDEKAKLQLINTAKMPFIYKWLAVMPDVHVGKGSTIGSVIPTKGAIIPAAVGVDIGCGIMAVKTSLNASDLPSDLVKLRHAIEKAVPHGRVVSRKKRDKGSWNDIPEKVANAWEKDLEQDFKQIINIAPKLQRANSINHLGTLGTGNHFIEVCLDEASKVWIVLHSGSRGIGNAIGSHFIDFAKENICDLNITLPDKDLAYFLEGTDSFNNYIFAVNWAQKFAQINREIMMDNVLETISKTLQKPVKKIDAIDCHHNYVAQEQHYGETISVTRKGAIRAMKGDMGIIPGSMGERSFIVKGLGNKESFCSCSHGAGRIMSRTEAKKNVSLDNHIKAIEKIECRKDIGVIDETPSAYKDIDKVMKAQEDLVKTVHTLKQIICVKG